MTYRLGTDGRGIATSAPRGPALGKARWLGDGCLLLEFRFLEDGETAGYRLRPDGRRLAVEYAYSAGFRTSFTAEAGEYSHPAQANSQFIASVRLMNNLS